MIYNTFSPFRLNTVGDVWRVLLVFINGLATAGLWLPGPHKAILIEGKGLGSHCVLTIDSLFSVWREAEDCGK
jgi:hypothetical protein